MRKKLLEEYVEHVYSIKTEHQSQLDRGGSNICITQTPDNQTWAKHQTFISISNTSDKFNTQIFVNWCLVVSVEEIYKQNLDDLSDIVDGDVDAAVRNVRLRAESALENLKTRDGNGNNKGAFKLLNTPDRRKGPPQWPRFKIKLNSNYISLYI